MSLDLASAYVMAALVEMLSMTFSMCGIRANRRMSRFASSQAKNALNFRRYAVVPEDPEEEAASESIP